MSPPWKSNYRIDWNFGDGPIIFSKFDTSNLAHYYLSYGSYLVTLSVFDTVSKTVIGKTSATLNLQDNAIDMNYLHTFTRLSMIFSGVRQYDTGQATINMIMTDFNNNDSVPNIQWDGSIFTVKGQASWSYIAKPDTNNMNTWSNNYFFEVITITGSISHSGNTIDSESYTFDHNEQHAIPNHPYCESNGNFLHIQSLPFTKKDSKSIMYHFSGTQLKNIMSSYLEYGSGMTINCNPPKDYYDIASKILWDQQPSLTVTFSQ
jgi:hypothetical protein